MVSPTSLGFHSVREASGSVNDSTGIKDYDDIPDSESSDKRFLLLLRQLAGLSHMLHSRGVCAVNLMVGENQIITVASLICVYQCRVREAQKNTDFPCIGNDDWKKYEADYEAKMTAVGARRVGLTWIVPADQLELELPLRRG